MLNTMTALLSASRPPCASTPPPPPDRAARPGGVDLELRRAAAKWIFQAIADA